MQVHRAFEQEVGTVHAMFTDNDGTTVVRVEVEDVGFLHRLRDMVQAQCRSLLLALHMTLMACGHRCSVTNCRRSCMNCLVATRCAIHASSYTDDH